MFREVCGEWMGGCCVRLMDGMDGRGWIEWGGGAKLGKAGAIEVLE